MKKLTRAELLRVMAAAAGAAGLGALAGCGDDDDDDGRRGTAGTGGAGGDGDMNGGAGTGGGVDSCDAEVGLAAAHIHEVTVPASDANAGAEQTYELSDVGGHTHMITVTEADFTTLVAGGSVEIDSSVDDGHSHTVVVTCS